MIAIPEYIQKHAARVRANAAEGTLFLKRDGSFPLERAGRLALFGNGARNTVKGGTGSGDVYCVRFNSCEQALEEAGFTVTTRAWLDAYDEERARAEKVWLEEKKRSVKGGNSLFLTFFGLIHGEEEYDIPLEGEGEACIYVLSRNSGEGMDRTAEKGNVFLTDTEVRDILALNEKFEKFLLVLNVGGVIDLSPVNGVKNILLLSQLGVATGDVLADIVLGKADPSGKLAATWAKYEDYQTIGEFGGRDDTRYREAVAGVGVIFAGIGGGGTGGTGRRTGAGGPLPITAAHLAYIRARDVRGAFRRQIGVRLGDLLGALRVGKVCAAGLAEPVLNVAGFCRSGRYRRHMGQLMGVRRYLCIEIVIHSYKIHGLAGLYGGACRGLGAFRVISQQDIHPAIRRCGDLGAGGAPHAAIGGYLAIPGDAERTTGPDAIVVGGGSGDGGIRQGDIP